jgi:hypothetical protein
MSSTQPRRTPPYVTMATSRQGLLAELQRRGARGGVIGLHRAMVTGRLTPWRITSMVFIPLALSAGVLLLLAPLTDVWAQVLTFAQPRLALAGTVARDAVELPGALLISVPYLTTVARLPVAMDYWVVGAMCAAAVVVSVALPRRFLPLAYFLRFAVLLQLTAFLNFALRPDAFPYDLPRYLQSLFHIGAAVLVLLPLVLGFTYFPFDVALWRKVMLAVLAVGHIAILVPLLALVHAYLIVRLSLLVMPTLFFLWGIIPLLFAFIAIYGWAMSWPEVAARATVGARSA